MFLKIVSWLKDLFKKEPIERQAASSVGWVQQWGVFIKDNVNLSVYDKATDITKIHPQWNSLNNEQKKQVLEAFYKYLIYYECGYDPKLNSVDVGVKGNKDTYSVGLMQLSVIDQSNLGIRLGYNFSDLQDPIKNLTLGLKIMENQINKRGKILIPKGEKGNPGVYWATLNPGNKYDKSEAILKEVHKLDFEAEAPVPEWYKIAQGEIGQKEITGGENPRIIEYHKTTTLKATEDEVPWCSSFVSWCLEKSGVKSTKNAWARSYLNWGAKIEEPKLGCICVFSRGSSSGHVGFFVSQTKNNVMVLGGNQGNSVCLKEYPKSRLLGYRWPQ